MIFGIWEDRYGSRTHDDMIAFITVYDLRDNVKIPSSSSSVRPRLPHFPRYTQ